jgi:glycosyltransferase involved in cell wall biosynthesis
MTAAQTIVVYSAVPWDHALMHLRIRGPAELAGFHVIQGNSGDQVDPDLINDSDLVIIQRDFPRFWLAYQEVVNIAKQSGRPMVYELDDLLFELPDDHSHRQDYEGYLAGMLVAVSEADLVTVSSEVLKKYILAINPNVKVLQNYLDDRIWCIEPSDLTGRNNGEVVIGYMGGETHRTDLEMVAPVLENILTRYRSKVILRFWGIRPPQVLLENPSTEWIAFNLLDYQRFASFFIEQQCDIFIAPLRDNYFNRAKSGIKYLEYSALAVPGVYSQQPAYTRIVSHGQNGFLAANSEEWEKYISQLIEYPNLRLQMGRAAQDNLLKNWLLKNHVEEWNDAYNWVLNHPHIGIDKTYNHWLGAIRQTTRSYEDIERELILEKNRAIAINQQLNEILESRSWRLVQKFQRLRSRLIPKTKQVRDPETSVSDG